MNGFEVFLYKDDLILYVIRFDNQSSGNIEKNGLLWHTLVHLSSYGITTLIED